ncbi:hypothetical protein ACFXOM_22555 [Streptomyces sp. NPDC059169]|uniref:hypothetical protein n=1 Tax=Streptomyces sp. NPDC059169 TaxID=3346754 RepID=UPI0036C1CAA3
MGTKGQQARARQAAEATIRKEAVAKNRLAGLIDMALEKLEHECCPAGGVVTAAGRSRQRRHDAVQLVQAGRRFGPPSGNDPSLTIRSAATRASPSSRAPVWACTRRPGTSAGRPGGEYSTHGLCIEPDLYDPKLDVDFTLLREGDLNVVGLDQAA